jgi:hypothetical protein
MVSRSAGVVEKVTREAFDPIIEEYGKDHGKWKALKRDRLLFVFDQIRKAGRSVNAGLKIGIPIAVVMPVTTTDPIFTQFAYDMSAFRKLNRYFCLTAIEHRDIKSRHNLN